MKACSYLGFFGLLLALPVLSLAQPATENFEFNLSEVKSVNIQNSMGRVDVAASLTDKAGVVLEKKRWGERCTSQVSLENGELKVISNDQNWMVDAQCRVDFIVSVPADVRSTIRVDRGDVNMTGIKGTTDIRIGNGSAKITGQFQDVKTWTNAGGIDFTGTSNTMSLRSAEGKVEVKLSHPPKPSSILNVNTGIGNIEISLPDNSTIFSETMTGNGLVRNEFEQERREHQLKIQANARSGDILILKK